MEIMKRAADFTSIRKVGGIVSDDRSGKVFQVEAKGKDGAIAIQGRNIELLWDTVYRAEGPGAIRQVIETVKGDKTPVIRIGDAERYKAVDVLGTHYAEGRITQQEHSSRCDLALAAQSQRQLDALLKDLPPLAPAKLAPDKDPVIESLLDQLFTATIRTGILTVLLVLLSITFIVGVVIHF
jgi:hypothetical protein